MAINGAEEGERDTFGFGFLPLPVTMKGCSGSREKIVRCCKGDRSSETEEGRILVVQPKRKGGCWLVLVKKMGGNVRKGRWPV
jgi:hypothetical protein